MTKHNISVMNELITMLINIAKLKEYNGTHEYEFLLNDSKDLILKELDILNSWENKATGVYNNV